MFMVHKMYMYKNTDEKFAAFTCSLHIYKIRCVTNKLI